jgi:hypothetical protein
MPSHSYCTWKIFLVAVVVVASSAITMAQQPQLPPHVVIQDSIYLSRIVNDAACTMVLASVLLRNGV